MLEDVSDRSLSPARDLCDRPLLGHMISFCGNQDRGVSKEDIQKRMMSMSRLPLWAEGDTENGHYEIWPLFDKEPRRLLLRGAKRFELVYSRDGSKVTPPCG